ncbi:MAG: hypothetical protein O7G85_07470 [Planctomycetota bacterium]|nr:hypothetical protein [Planctomycetota bacterium]
MLKGPTAEKIGSIITRVLVPVWILTGATFKLIAQNPATLPKFTIFDPAAKMGVDLDILLNSLIGLEILAIAVIVFMPRFSRLMAGFMLGSFVLILINELIQGAENCGCFGGKISIHPGVMLSIDGALLLGVILLPLARTEGAKPLRGAIPTAVTTILGFIASFGVMAMSQNPTVPPPPVVEDTLPSNTTPTDPCAADPVQIAFPRNWYVSGEISDWIGQCWNQVDLFKLLRTWPEDLAQGEKLVVLYRTDCDHCEEMFKEDFTGKVQTPIFAYHIPLDGDPTWELPENHTASLYDLSPETNWIITSPLVVKLVDGKVVCAAEGEGFEPCLGVEPHDH